MTDTPEHAETPDWERIAARLAAALRAEMGDGREARPRQWPAESYEALTEFDTERTAEAHRRLADGQRRLGEAFAEGYRRMGASITPHVHQLKPCPECDYWHARGSTCSECDDRGYLEFCDICGQPMGNRRRAWKRRQRTEEGPTP